MRPKHIETPEAMWDLFEAYKRWCKENPRYSYSLSTKTGEATAVPLERPLTQVGFRTFAAFSVHDNLLTHRGSHPHGPNRGRYDRAVQCIHYSTTQQPN
jgi:hypothetical protein